jgi:Pathogenicity locus
MATPAKQFLDKRVLKDLRGIGPRMLEDFDRLGVSSVRQLKTQSAAGLYERMCVLRGTRQDPCVLDTYRCAIEQARNPDLPEEQRDWWYWSRVRKLADKRTIAV